MPPRTRSRPASLLENCLLAPHQLSPTATTARKEAREPLRRYERATSQFSNSSFSSLKLLMLMSCLLLLTPVESLRILLTNDDGIAKPGIQSLRTALIDAGHEVHVYAPAADRTGLAASVQLFSVPFTPLEANQTIVEGPPATCVVAGLSFMTQNLLNFPQPIGPPDLVIVGISDGFATGPQTLHSSAVGAALTALGRNIPSLTIGGLPVVPDISQEEYFQNVANFTVSFLQTWTNAIPLDEVPRGFGLKIAYPPLTPSNVAGVAIATNGNVAPISLGYAPSAEDPTVYQVVPVELDVSAPTIADPSNSENNLVNAGFISVLPISNQWYVTASEFHVRYILTLKRMVQNITVQ